MERVISYFYRIGIALSVLLNVLLGGPSNQTFSARNWQWKREGKPNIVFLLDAVFFLENQHCMTSWVYWRLRKDV